MLRFLIIVIILQLTALAGVSSPANEQLTRIQNQIYRSYITGNVPMWERSVNELERMYNNRSDVGILYDLLLARYGFIAFSLENDASKARQHLTKAETELEILFTHRAYQAHAYALQGAFLGFRISLRPLMAVSLGPRSYRAINNAMEADRNNPLVWMEMGNSRFYTPSTFGGSKQEAQESYLRAVQLFERNMLPNHNWLYLNSLVGLAKSYQYLNQRQLAIDTYKKALTFEPEFKWVRDELLPGLLK